MALTHEEIQKIKDEIKEEIRRENDERYVLVTDCNDTQADNQKTFANNDKRIDLILQKVTSSEKLTWIIVTAIVGILATAIFELILR